MVLFALLGCFLSCRQKQELPDDPEGGQISLRAGSLTKGEQIDLLYQKDGKLVLPDVKAESTPWAGRYIFSLPAGSAGASCWYGIVPYSRGLMGVSSDGASLQLRLGPVQFPGLEDVDPYCDFRVSSPFQVSAGKAEMENLKRVFAPICLTVKGLPEEEKIYALTMSSSQVPEKYAALTGLFYVRLGEDAVVSFVDGASMGNAVSAEYKEGLPFKDGGWPVWLMVNPITLRTGTSLTVSLSTSNRTYTRTITLPENLSLSMEGPNRIDFDILDTGASAQLSVTQDFTENAPVGTRTLTCSDGRSLEWRTTSSAAFGSTHDGNSGIGGAMMLNGESFTFPEMANTRIVGARVFTHPCSGSRADTELALTVDGKDKYPFNLAAQTVTESLSWKGGIVNIVLPKGRNSLSGLTVTVPAAVHLISAITLFLEYDSYTPDAEDLKVDLTLFKLLNLDYPPLAEVYSLYASGRYKLASESLLRYFKNRPAVVNPAVTLPVTAVSADVRKIAEDAMPEKGYRFAVHAGQYYESYSGGKYTYYSFSDGHGGINWEYEMPNSGTQCYQKHWHAWFLPMAQMFSYSGNEQWFTEWKAQYSDWMSHYPCPSQGSDPYTRDFGYNTWHALSMATRIENQTQLFEYFIPASGWDFKWLTTFLKAFHETVEYSRDHLYYNEESNIRFAQYKSHCLAALLFPEFKRSELWLSDGASTVSNYFDTAFASDGCLIELDANYHSGEVMNFISVYNAALANGRLQYFGSGFLDKLYDACSFLSDYCYPDGRWEIFNDTRQQSANVTRRWIGTFASLYPGDNKFLYLSTGGKSGFKPTEALREYRTSGYYMFRSDWASSGIMLIYKNNYNPKDMWHAHRDNGTVGFYRNGRIFLPSSGSYTYGDGKGGTLDYERAVHQAASNHNTLTCELADIAPTFSKGRYMASYTNGTASCVVAQNDSYSDLTHRRTVWMVNKSFFVIADAAYGTAAGKTVNLSWHLCRDTAGSMGADVVSIDNDASHYAYGAHTSFSDGNNILLKSFSETMDGFSTQTGLSWCSENFGERYQRKFYRVNARKATGSSVVRFITVLYPCSDPAGVNVSASFKTPFTASGESLSVTINGTTYDLSYSL